LELSYLEGLARCKLFYLLAIRAFEVLCP